MDAGALEVEAFLETGSSLSSAESFLADCESRYRHDEPRASLSLFVQQHHTNLLRGSLIRLGPLRSRLLLVGLLHLCVRPLPLVARLGRGFTIFVLSKLILILGCFRIGAVSCSVTPQLLSLGQPFLGALCSGVGLIQRSRSLLVITTFEIRIDFVFWQRPDIAWSGREPRAGVGFSAQSSGRKRFTGENLLLTIRHVLNANDVSSPRPLFRDIRRNGVRVHDLVQTSVSWPGQ